MTTLEIKRQLAVILRAQEHGDRTDHAQQDNGKNQPGEQIKGSEVHFSTIGVRVHMSNIAFSRPQVVRTLTTYTCPPFRNDPDPGHM